MKKKISIVLAGLGLCASMMMFNVQEANATVEPAVVIKFKSRICVFGGDRCVTIRAI